MPGPAPQLPLDAFLNRRARAADAVGDDAVLVVATHPEMTYSNDVEHRFRPHSDFWYLTGFDEPEAVLVLEGDSGTSTLFLRERHPEREVWTGRRLGLERAGEALGVDRVQAFGDLSRRIGGLVGKRQLLGNFEHDPGTRTRIRRAAGHEEDGREITATMRLRKDPDEIRLLRRAADVGVRAFEEAARLVRPGSSEHAVEGALLSTYRRAGSTGPGYQPIVGAGRNAAVLHYTRNQDPIKDGQLVLVDAGCEWGYYNSDITRTFGSGGWSDEQADLYDLVLESQKAALREVRPGNTIRDPHHAACRVLAEGLVERGILEGDPEKLVEAGDHRAFYMHGTSHFLGLDVHDVGGYRAQGNGEPTKLEPGMVITVEPGLYFNPDYAQVPAGLSGIGIRIEDDVVVTEDGLLNLTKGLPTNRDELDSLVGKA